MKKTIIALLLIIATCAGTVFCADTNTSGEDSVETNVEEEMDMSNIITPEKMGISSADIAATVEGYKNEELSMHSVLVMRRGKIIAEGYADPFDENSFHRMYSTRKSFVDIAIGILESEGKISPDDTIDRYFPDYVSENTDRGISNSKISDLLKMASPYITADFCLGGDRI